MILAIDIGNSNTVFSCMDNGRVIAEGRTETDPNITAEQFGAQAERFLAANAIDSGGLEKAVIASVVPRINDAACAACAKWGVMRLTYDADHGIELATDHPERVGEDLISGALGAAAIAPLPAIIVDMGTATTVTALDKNRRYLGGLILAGMRISLDALHEKTAQLPKIDGMAAPTSMFAKNTADSMSAGAVYSTAAMIDGICSGMERELGAKCSVTVTGGLAKLILPYCQRPVTYEPDLVPRGLWEFYKRSL